MSKSKDARLSLKVVMNKQKTKVLFAEASSDVVDVLLSFLTLPLGKLVKILEKHDDGDEAAAVGSLTTLYGGLSNLHSSHFCKGGSKQMFLNPTSSFEKECCRLKLDVSDSQPSKVYYCEDKSCPNDLAKNASLFSDIAECDCGKPLNRGRCVKKHSVSGDDGVFVNKSSSFIICDDLRVVPAVSGFSQTLKLKNLGITHIDGAETTTLSIGINEIKDLLKLSLFSPTPLTDLVFKKTTCTAAAKPDQRGLSLLHHTANDNSWKMTILKVFLHKSTNKFLLTEAADDFVEFLLSFLAIPLAGVEYLCSGKTCLKNIDNLYRSVTDVIDHKYFTTAGVEQRLTNPKLLQGYVSRHQILPLTETNPRHGLKLRGVPMVFKPSIGKGRFMKDQTMYMVSDDLTVSPLSITSSFSILMERGISLSDVKEKDFVIGVEEALGILKASLISTTVLSDALINPMINKPPKQSKKQSKIEKYAHSLCLGYLFHH